MPSPLGQSTPHDSGMGHVTGRSLFIDDLPMTAGELLVDVVGSPVAHGTITRLDLTEAAQIPGVVGLYTARDIPGHNLFGPIFADERLLAEDEVVYIEEPVVVIAAETRAALTAARRAICLEVLPMPAILSMEQAVAAGSFIGPRREIKRGDAAQALPDAPHRLDGTMHLGGQEHLYFESQAALAYPGEDGHLTIHSSTQNPTEIQHMVAHALGLGQHQIVCLCKRMGGAFGGKESQAAAPAALAALVALKTGRPARLVYRKGEDMRRTGKRHPYQARYRVGFTDDGVITALDVALYSDGGASADLSTSVMDRSLFHVDNAYFIPDITLTGNVCRTNLPSNTAFRGFGGPQAVAVMENILEEIAQTLGLDAYDVRRRCCYGPTGRRTTPYGQVFAEGSLPVLFDRLAETARYRERRAEVQAFNAHSKTHLKGLSMTLVKFGISFTSKFLNQANALVNVYTDGTVQVSTGGTEMGQGLNTKIQQLVADQFGLAPGSVRVMPTSTEKNNNTPPTAASAGTDLNGAAAVQACAAIRARLADLAAPILESIPERIVFENGCVLDPDHPERQIAFADLANRAYRERISLGERAFYATPGLDPANPFRYYTTGGALAEVLIDRRTGVMTTQRVDLLMDIGRPINPAIDRGQLIGGFVQGMGWVTTEELKYAADGELLTDQMSHYKIPSIKDIPKVFNVAFVEDAENPVGVASSKAVGEPPLLLAVSVWTAVKDALAAACEGLPQLPLPATPEQILLCLHRQARPSRGQNEP
jgi:xanthine dehydrogenase large subunit